MNDTYWPVRVVGLHAVRIVKPRGSVKSNETRLPRETLDALGTGIESVNDDIADLADAVADANLQVTVAKHPRTIGRPSDASQLARLYLADMQSRKS